jgi:hypothetical protein
MADPTELMSGNIASECGLSLNKLCIILIVSNINKYYKNFNFEWGPRPHSALLGSTLARTDVSSSPELYYNQN